MQLISQHFSPPPQKNKSYKEKYEIKEKKCLFYRKHVYIYWKNCIGFQKIENLTD